MAVNWPVNVNKKAYGMNSGAKNNLESVDFESGKSRTYLKNSSPKMIFSFNLSFLDDGTSTCEYRLFWSWWQNVLLSGSESFYFENLLTHSGYKEYKMTQVPTSTGQNPKEVSLSVEEV